MKAWIGRNKYELDTPCLVIDLDILNENLLNMQQFAHAHGKALRPHAKTHKCSIIARKQIEAGAVGICTAKISEAEVLVNRGILGVLVTGPVVTRPKIECLMRCLEIDPSLMVVTDNPENARVLDAACTDRGLSLKVLLDVDVGLGRTGVYPEGACELADRIAAFTSLRFQGIQAYAGHVQHMKKYDERCRASQESMEKAADVFRRLNRDGYGCTIFTGAGTGTYDIDVMIPELTDLQVGSYVVMDAEYMGIGSANSAERFTTFRPALTLLSAVISMNRKGFATIDAGLKTLYRDGAAPLVVKPHGLLYEWFGDEYGKISFTENRSALKLGDVIELVVSHCDPTINLFDKLYVTQKDVVVDIWEVDLRGKSQ